MKSRIKLQAKSPFIQQSVSKGADDNNAPENHTPKYKETQRRLMKLLNEKTP